MISTIVYPIIVDMGSLEEDTDGSELAWLGLVTFFWWQD